MLLSIAKYTYHPRFAIKLVVFISHVIPIERIIINWVWLYYDSTAILNEHLSVLGGAPRGGLEPCTCSIVMMTLPSLCYIFEYVRDCRLRGRDARMHYNLCDECKEYCSKHKRHEPRLQCHLPSTGRCWGISDWTWNHG